MNAICVLTGVTQMWPCNSSHLLVSSNCPQPASWICSVCAAAFAFQASDGFDEESWKSPFEAAVRIKASWLQNDFPHLTQYSGKFTSNSFVIGFFRNFGPHTS